MFGLPPNTIVNQTLTKKAFYEKFNLRTVERERFDADISRMTIMAEISPNRIPALVKGKEIEVLYVLQVVLKRKEYDTKNILLLQKLIPQNIVFALQYDGSTQLCIFHTRLQQSEWMPSDEAIIPLQGLNLDDVWNNNVASIGGLDAASEETIEQQIINREQKERLLRQIEVLEKKCRLEKQTHKKYELHQELLKLKSLIQ